MKFKSQIITQASGSIGGVTASHNSSGMYMRARSIPVNPSSVYQQAVRNALQTLSAAWNSALSSAQRNAWAVYAQAVPVVDKLGDQIYLTGLNHYVRSNVPLIQAGKTIVDDAPTVFNTGSFTPVTISASEATSQIDVAFDNADDWANEDDARLLVYASRPQSPSVNFFKGPFRFTDTVEGDSVTPPTSPAPMNAPFSLTAGQRLYASVRASFADGRLTSAQRVTCLVQS